MNEGITIEHTDSNLEESELNSEEPLQCLVCNVNFTNKEFLNKHVLHHVTQPYVLLERLPPLRLTIKNRSGTSFEIVSPVTSPADNIFGNPSDQYQPSPAEENTEVVDNQNSDDALANCNGPSAFSNSYTFGDSYDQFSGESVKAGNENCQLVVNYSPNGGNFGDSTPNVQYSEEDKQGAAQLQEIDLDRSCDNTEPVDNVFSAGSGAEQQQPYGHVVPGAEPTPPPDPSPTHTSLDYPKIKIKTTGLFKDPEPRRGCTITELANDDADGGHTSASTIWTTPSLDDSLKLPENDSFMSLFTNDRSPMKDGGGYSGASESEFISLDAFHERNRGAMQVYNPQGNGGGDASSTSATSALQSLAGLPMQALAQQVSRMNSAQNHQSGGGVHQQNVLINIQQFPTQPPQQQVYPPPPQSMYPPPPPYGQPAMHQHYPYQPVPNPMYPPYQGAPSYPPQHMPPRPPQHHQMGAMAPPPTSMGGMSSQQSRNSMIPSTQHQQMLPPNSMQGSYRPTPSMVGNRPTPTVRGPSGVRMPNAPLRPPSGPRGGSLRTRMPAVRPRGILSPQQPAPQRGQYRARMAGPPIDVRQPQMKRNGADQMAAPQTKRKKMDVLTPSDKDDDDCQVICMQPKNTGLPQIESIQGASEQLSSSNTSIVKLPDSITLSVRNPPPKPPPSSVQKSDATAVANVLASRGITVTPSTKKEVSPATSPPSAKPAALSLNGAVSITASAKSNGNPNKANAQDDSLMTVDLTDEVSSLNATQNKNGKLCLPFKCDLCPAQYPNEVGLQNHRLNYHKTTAGVCELAIPLINLKQPGIIQKLSKFGIHSYVPLGPGGIHALPIINAKNPGNVGALAVTQMISLGPVHTVPRRIPSSSDTNNVVKK